MRTAVELIPVMGCDRVSTCVLLKMYLPKSKGICVHISI